MMRAETDQHERTLMAWPTEVRRSFFGGHLTAARRAWAGVARAIADFEPVTMVVNPGERSSAEALLAEAVNASRHEVELVELAIDDAWMRDSGPVVVRARGLQRELGAQHRGLQRGGVGGLAPHLQRAALLAGLRLVERGVVRRGGALGGGPRGGRGRRGGRRFEHAHHRLHHGARQPARDPHTLRPGRATDPDAVFRNVVAKSGGNSHGAARTVKADTV